MHNDHRARAVSDPGQQILWVHIECVVYFATHWNCAGLDNRFGRCNKREALRNHFIARLQVEHGKRHSQGRGSGSNGKRVWNIHELGKRHFKIAHFVAIVAHRIKAVTE